MNFSLVLQIFSCFFMTGVLWLVQILVYPNFRHVNEPDFKSFHEQHTKRITWVVGPMMLIELVTGTVLWWTEPNLEFLINLILILITWFLTGFVSVPLHNRLHENTNRHKNLLIWTNWPRTVIWTLRSILWIGYLSVH